MSSTPDNSAEILARFPSFMPGTDRRLASLAEWILSAKTVVWFTGAGISTASGLPDYRGPRGTKVIGRGRRPKRRIPLEEASPNPAHVAIVQLEKLGNCAFLISQNVDNLHLKSGYPNEKLAELHGNATRLRCRPCGKTYPCETLGIQFSELKSAKKETRRRSSKTLPWACPGCGEFLEDSVINFKDPMPEQELEAARRFARVADLMIVVGSTCEVVPAADLPKIVNDNGGRLVIMNRGKTGLDNLFHLEFRYEDVSELLPRLVELVQQRKSHESV